VIPVYFQGPVRALFHLASRVSLTLRTSLLVREFRRLSGSAIVAYPGEVLAARRACDDLRPETASGAALRRGFRTRNAAALAPKSFEIA
jgi:putative hemolysin